MQQDLAVLLMEKVEAVYIKLQMSTMDVNLSSFRKTIFFKFIAHISFELYNIFQVLVLKNNYETLFKSSR